MDKGFLPAKIAVILFVTVFCFNPLCASDSLQVANVRFEATSDQVIVSYDLLPPSDPTLLEQKKREYTITLVLKREQDESFRFIPRYVTGDAGAGITEGSNKRIIWQISKELPRGLEGDDFYFVVQVDAIVERTTPWLWLGAGAAVLGGTIAAILIFRGNEGPPPLSKFPDPPGRP